MEYSFLHYYLWGGALILALMLLLWLVSLLLKNSSIVDIFWGAGFVLSAWFMLCSCMGLYLCVRGSFWRW